MTLSILIATVPERKELFEALKFHLSAWCLLYPIEILFDDAPRGVISIGKKRQLLLERARGEYIVYFDDDDWPKPYYGSSILNALMEKPDCVGFKIAMTTNGKNPETCIHSLRNKIWEFKNGIYLRNVTHFNPVRREIALQVGFEDIRFGEDKIYSDKVTHLCKTEVFIDDYLFDYRYSTAESHGKKYGFEE